MEIRSERAVIKRPFPLPLKQCTFVISVIKLPNDFQLPEALKPDQGGERVDRSRAERHTIEGMEERRKSRLLFYKNESHGKKLARNDGARRFCRR